jgi:glucuronate isomerase
VFPTFRPDKALLAGQPELLNAWLERLGAAANVDVGSLDDLLEALAKRHQYFHDCGCRMSDHGLARCFATPCAGKTAARIFERARGGKAASAEEHEQWATFLMLFFGRLDADKGWTKQLHLGAQRNNNSRLLARLGPDTGFDSIGDEGQARSLAGYLNLLDSDGALPRTIIYNNNPADNYAVATMLGNFNDGSVAGKIQMGAGWWFLDQKEGIEWQLNALSNNGLLSRFVGMVTDSRSFMSYPRHEYFRRTLCALIGQDVERGELPDDDELLGGLIRNVCYENARDYLRLPFEAAEGAARQGARKRTARARRE